MARRPAIVTKADISRAIRTAQAAALTIVRVVVRSDGVAIETMPAAKQANQEEDEEREPWIM